MAMLNNQRVAHKIGTVKNSFGYPPKMVQGKPTPNRGLKSRQRISRRPETRRAERSRSTFSKVYISHSLPYTIVVIPITYHYVHMYVYIYMLTQPQQPPQMHISTGIYRRIAQKCICLWVSKFDLWLYNYTDGLWNLCTTGDRRQQSARYYQHVCLSRALQNLLRLMLTTKCYASHQNCSD